MDRPGAIDAALLPLAAADGQGTDRGAGDTPEARRGAAEFLEVAELVNLATVGAHGWPVAHCMHFATHFEAGDRPIVYMFTNDGTRKQANVAADPRVALTVFNPRHEDGPAMPYLRMRGVAKLVTDPGERELAMQAQFNKVNYEFARYLGLETQPALRVDVVEAQWTAAGAPTATLDYRAQLEAVS